MLRVATGGNVKRILTQVRNAEQTTCYGLCTFASNRQIQPLPARLSRQLDFGGPSIRSIARYTSDAVIDTDSAPLTDIATVTRLSEGSFVRLGGWLVSIRRLSRSLAFAVLLLPRGQGRLQLISRKEDLGLTDTWEEAGLHGAVLVEGILSRRPKNDQRDVKGKGRVSATKSRESHQMLQLTTWTSPIFSPLLS